MLTCFILLTLSLCEVVFAQQFPGYKQHFIFQMFESFGFDVQQTLTNSRCWYSVEKLKMWVYMLSANSMFSEDERKI